MANEQYIVRLKALARIDYLSMIVEFTGNLVEKLGLSKNESQALQLVTEEACLNVIEHAFDKDEVGQFALSIERQAGRIVIGVEDQGLPFDFTKFQPDENKGLGMLLMRAFADEIRFLNIGRGGKRVEIVKNLSYQEIKELKETQPKEQKEIPLASKEEKLTMRLMNSDDAVNMARCIYRSYGYTYGWEFIYYPEKVKELLESGYLTSCIYLNSQDEIIGHFAMVRPQPDDLVGETGMAVVDPRYRGRGLFKKMKLFMAEAAVQKGVYGFYSEAVAVHPYSQKGNLSLGARETGVLLGLSPATMQFKNIEKKSKTRRTPALFFYYKIQDGPKRISYLPFHHKAIIKTIYDMNKLNRKVIDKNKDLGKLILAKKTQLDITIKPERKFAFLKIVKFGEDLVDLVKFRLRELCFRQMNCIYIDLPLSEPASQKFCASLEMLGFFFAGVIPEMNNGDVLRLQYLNNVEVDPNEIVTASEFGEELADYVSRAYRSMMER